MKIYIVFPGPLYPIYGMSQVRMLNQLICLSQDHQLVFSDILARPDEIKKTRQNMKELGMEYRPVFTSSYGRKKPIKAALFLAIKIRLLFSAKIREELILRSGRIKRQVLDVVRDTQADALLVHYWYLGHLFKHLDRHILKLMDTHYLVEEHHELMREGKYSENTLERFIHKRKLDSSLKTQREYFLQSDLVIVNSQKQETLIHQWDPQVHVNVTVNGQDLEPYLNYEYLVEPETAVLFYGSLGNQFNRRALKRILTNILPRIRESVPECKLYIVGANPPNDILAEYNDDLIVTTGYVEDVKPHLTRCKIMLLPLETGSGFRGRTVELLALGIPIVGTWNAMQSVGFLDGEIGYLAETDDDIAAKAVHLLGDQELWERMSNNCRAFAQRSFSLESTYGKMSDLIAGIYKLSKQNYLSTTPSLSSKRVENG